MKSSLLVTCVLTILISSSAVAQNFTLFEAQTYALENAEQIKNAELDLEIAQKKVVETRAIGLPQINAEGNFNHFMSLPVQVVDGAFIGQPGTLVNFRAGTDYSMTGGVAVNQLIFDGSYLVGLQVSKFYKEFVSTNIELTQEQVLMNVTKAYEIALVSRENMRFMDSLVLSTEKLLNKQKELYALDLILQEDLDQINYAFITAQTNQVSAKYQYENALTFLKMTMAYPMDKPIELIDNLEIVLNKALSEVSNDQTLDGNIQLDLLNKRLALSRYELKNTKFANLPSLGAFFQHKYDAYRNEFNFFDNNGDWFEQTFVGVRLSVPIFSSGARWSRTQQAQIEIEKREYEINEYKRSLQMQEAQYNNDLRSAKDKLQLQQENVRLAKSIYENAVVRSEIGKESSLMVTQKYTQVISAQAQYVGAMVDVFNARLNIDILYNNLIQK
jgi:outer membrane protein TolC